MTDWEAQYQKNEIGWDAGKATPGLEHWCETTTQRFQHIGAPGVGTGYDLIPLSKIGIHVTALDVAPSAKLRFEDKVKTHVDSNATVDYLITDFFQYGPDAIFDLVWDYTFLCAIDPSQRQEWAKTMARLIKPSGTLLALIFPVGTRAGGPPFTLIPEKVHELLAEDFELISCEAPVGNHEDRKGVEFLTEYRRR